MADRSHSPVKVAIFMEFFLPYLGGIERYQDRLSEQLRLLGYDVFIVTSLHDESLPRFEDKDGLRIYRLPTKGLFKQRYPFFKRDKRFKETMAAVEAENADFYIVNTRFHLTSLLGARLAHHLGRPVARRPPAPAPRLGGAPGVPATQAAEAGRIASALDVEAAVS